MTLELAPSDIEAEENAIAAAMLPDGWPLIGEMASLIQPRDFFREANGEAWSAILDVWNRGAEVNQSTVAHEMAKHDRLDNFGGQARLGDYIRGLPWASSGTWYAGLVRNAAIARRVMVAAHQVMQAAQENPEDADALIDMAAERFIAMGTNRAKALTRSVREILDGSRSPSGIGVVQEISEFLDDPEEVRGLATGWDVLDEMLNGFQKTVLYTVLGDTSVGKSFFVHFVFWMLAMSGVPVLLFTTEMSGDEVTERLVYMAAGLDKEQLRHNKAVSDSEKQRLAEAQSHLADLPIYVCDVGGLSLGTLEAEARRQVSVRGVQLVAVDMMGDLRSGDTRGNRAGEIDQVMKALKGIAMNEDVPVITTAHINRASAASGKALGMHSGKDGSGIEQNTNVLLTLDAVGHDQESGWYVLEEEEADVRRNRDNFLCIRVRASKNRGGRKKSDVRVLDWRQGGRFVEPNWGKS
jgi:replicative DNA helicase